MVQARFRRRARKVRSPPTDRSRPNACSSTRRSSAFSRIPATPTAATGTRASRFCWSSSAIPGSRIRPTPATASTSPALAHALRGRVRALQVAEEDGGQPRHPEDSRRQPPGVQGPARQSRSARGIRARAVREAWRVQRRSTSTTTHWSRRCSMPACRATSIASTSTRSSRRCCSRCCGSRIEAAHSPEPALETAAFTIFLYPRMVGCAAEIDDHMNRGRNMDTRTPASQVPVRGVKARRHQIQGPLPRHWTLRPGKSVGRNREDQLEDDRSAHCLAGDLPAADPGGPQCQPMALLRGLCRGDHGPGARVDAGGCGRAHRPHFRCGHGLRRVRSQQIAAVGAQRIRGEYRLAHRRRVRVRDRLSQERAGQADRPAAGARPGPAHARPGLRRDVRRPDIWPRRRRRTPRAAAAPSIRSSATFRRSMAPSLAPPRGRSAPM